MQFFLAVLAAVPLRFVPISMDKRSRSFKAEEIGKMHKEKKHLYRSFIPQTLSEFDFVHCQSTHGATTALCCSCGVPMVPNQSGPWNPCSLIPQQNMLGISANNVVPGVPRLPFQKVLRGPNTCVVIPRLSLFTVPRFRQRYCRILRFQISTVVSIAGFQDSKVVKFY